MAPVIALDDNVDVVFRFESGDREVEVPRFKSQLRQTIGLRFAEDPGAVRQELGSSAELVGVVVGDPLRVRDQRVRPADRQLLRKAVIAASEPAPLAAQPLQAVHVHRGGDPAGTEQ